MKHEFSGDRRESAARLYAEAVGALSVTRDQTTEITSLRQLRIWEDTARRIQEMDVDAGWNAHAAEMLEQAGAARRWAWVDGAAAVALAMVGIALGIVSAVIGGLSDNIPVALAGALAGSMILGAVVLRYRRENWRVRAEQIAPLIWKPGV